MGEPSSRGSAARRVHENQVNHWNYEKLCLSGKVLGLLSCFCHTTAPPVFPEDQSVYAKQLRFLQHFRHSSCARQEKDAAPQESDAPHSWLQVESLHGKLSLSSAPASSLLLLSSYYLLLMQSWRTLQLLSWAGAHLSLGFKTKEVEIVLRMAGAGMWVVEGVETIFIAMPKAFASRLYEIHCYFSARWLALPYAAQLVAARAFSYCIWYRGPVFIQYFIRNILGQINSLWCQWILF